MTKDSDSVVDSDSDDATGKKKDKDTRDGKNILQM